MYNKLFTKILDSSIWLEPMPTRIVFLTFIASMDETGFVAMAAIGNVANRARVSLQEAQEAIKTLESKDPESGNPTNEGRRIERVPGGWIVLNAGEYRLMATRAIIQEQTRERVRKHRAEKRSGNALCNASVTPSDTDTRSDQEQMRIDRASVHDEFDAFWRRYPKKVGKGAARKAWHKMRPNLDQVMNALAWQIGQPKWQEQKGAFVPHPATWLNQSRWEDEPFHEPSPLQANDAAWAILTKKVGH